MASRSAKAGMKKGKMQVYNAKNSKAVDAAEDEEGEFNKGGVAKKKRDHEKLKNGGHVDGHMAKHRADKKSRGAHHMAGGNVHHMHHHVHKRAAGGKTPYSSGKNTSMDSISGKTDQGHEGQRPPE